MYGSAPSSRAGRRRSKGSHRFWSRRKRAPPSSGLLETLPMTERHRQNGHSKSWEGSRRARQYESYRGCGAERKPYGVAGVAVDMYGGRLLRG